VLSLGCKGKGHKDMNNRVKDIFHRLSNCISWHNGEATTFDEIIGHNDIKIIVGKAINSKGLVHILLVGSPASAKTIFLTQISRHFKSSLFIVGSNTTKAGLVDQMFQRMPNFLIIDELEKMKKDDQATLLELMETKTITETKFTKTRRLQVKSRVFATANSCENIIQPLLSRFLVLEIPEYTFDEFKDIVVYRLKREGVDKVTAICIAEKVWNELDSRDVRDALKVGRLANNIQEAENIVKIIRSYSIR
jgi:DNA replicative helicase MCM subunit Mcm2 (Cdc46/Mcm family)